jgi:uncharacterized membrane protein
MIVAEITFAGRAWLPLAAVLAVCALAMLAWAYAGARSAAWVRGLAVALKTVGILALVVCLVEPMFRGTRPQPGINRFLVAADTSRSLQLSDGSRQTRGQTLQARLAEDSPWLTRLGQDFDVRRYTFDTTLRPVKEYKTLAFDGQGSALAGSLRGLADRFRGQPVAGILVFTDGNATDLTDQASWQGLPPVYPVILGGDESLVDLSVARVSVSQTNFDAAPVTIAVEIDGQGVAGKSVVVRVLDESGKEVERREVAAMPEGRPLAQRFLIKPEQAGVSFYHVEACLAGEEKSLDGARQGGASPRTAEATLANNRRLATVDRGGGPYRVLYVGGRPNWEYKFLARALDGDDELKLVGLVRIAKKEPRFAFLGRSGERNNPLFRGFSNQGDETAEQYDQPVLLRLTDDAEELRGGFPKDAEDLYRYHAIVLDDVEAAFFTQDQQSLVQQFVSQRGGGLLMLGGKDSFEGGGYQRTPIGDMLPVYLDRGQVAPPEGGWRLALTREGWLQPWVRVRTTQPDEERRLAEMPPLRAVNTLSSIKPGASVLAQVEAAGSETVRPALVVQPLGRGRSGALLVGDLWRWDMHRKDPAQSDLEKAWRQTVRWLVSDVPQPVEVEVRPAPAVSSQAIELVVRARDKLFQPLDNATATVKVKTPEGREVELTADASSQRAGEYLAAFVPRATGAYRASVVVTAPDGSEVGRRETGWAVEPDTEEFRTLPANRALLARIAQETGGEVLEPGDLESFVADLPNRKIPITEAWTYPLWHQWSVFAFALVCLVGEWGLRRWKGLP